MVDLLTVARGSKVYTTLDGPEMAEGSKLEFPVVVIRGVKDGPKLYVGGAIHGDEYPPVAALGAIVQRIDPHKLSGVFVAVPVQNPLGFRAQTTDPPTAHRSNMYNAFPGKPDGDISQQMAHVLFANLISKMDYVIDLHTGRGSGDFLSQTYFAPLELGPAAVKGKELAEVFGAEQYNVEGYGPDGMEREGYLHTVLAKRGIPATVAELSCRMETAISQGVRGVMNIMIHIGMLEGKIEGPRSKVLIKGPPDRPQPRATKGGLIFYVAKLGDKLSKGDPIARIVDVYGREVELVRSPVNGILQMVSIHPMIQPGDRVCRIGIPV